MDIDHLACYRAVLARDERFDGRFYTAVKTTGIYCRPVCPTPPPKAHNCMFFASAAAAQAAGFRPCIRCRPELAPGHAGWSGTHETLRRAISLMAEGAPETENLPDIAAAVGVGERQLRRIFREQTGASAIEFKTVHRILFAKALIVDTDLAMAEIAFASGFGSIRRFNAAFQQMYGRPPHTLRKQGCIAGGCGIVLRLGYRKPFNWSAFLAFLAPRAIRGVEAVTGETYRRSLRAADGAALVTVTDDPQAGVLVARVQSDRVAALSAVAARLRRFFDLDADPAAIAAVLGADPLLAPLLETVPGRRIPGTMDSFELAVRAIVGQQVSVTGARTIVGRIAERWGEPLDLHLGALPPDGPLLLFPQVQALVNAPLEDVGVMPARARAIRALAAALVEDPELLNPAPPPARTVARLLQLPGIGPWTAQYVAIRALGDPDAFPAGDLGLLKATSSGRPHLTPRALELRSQAWRPWRAYAAIHLWASQAATTDKHEGEGEGSCHRRNPSTALYKSGTSQHRSEPYGVRSTATVPSFTSTS
ncbi:AlkA N-terminal domain-containing protein [Gloeobacter violaceus]|uniref:DNA-3-methyladenine glycosylase II n=1 Tax=Gloeobacter violaceus (strain ATCC 29082 / PCC 7421) TaxID=251221 RepID=Q7NFB7_GLOVI|nr:AlkA N-terminal domain-containing protein [Gloeobacter violaceus]BAC91550.1 AraC family transcriptional regulatory protein [Gloeobacter violaceus PCC 7421]